MADSNATPTESGGRYDFDPKEYLQQGAWRDVRLGLHRTEELLERLGRPQDSLKIVHVAGTNGKGSTCAFIASILQEAGYKTVCSPRLTSCASTSASRSTAATSLTKICWKWRQTCANRRWPWTNSPPRSS